MDFFNRISCKSAIRSITLDYENILSLSSVFLLLESCPNLEVLSLKEYSGFTPEDFLEHLEEWTTNRISTGATLLRLKEINLSMLGEWDFEEKHRRLTFTSKAYNSTASWENSGTSFVEQVKALLESVSKGSIAVKPVVCGKCSLAVTPFQKPIACCYCDLTLKPVCEECQTYSFCKLCQKEYLGTPTFVCQDCTDPDLICYLCEEWICEDCGGLELDIETSCLSCFHQSMSSEGTPDQCRGCRRWYSEYPFSIDCSVCQADITPVCDICQTYKWCQSYECEAVVCRDCNTDSCRECRDWNCKQHGGTTDGLCEWCQDQEFRRLHPYAYKNEGGYY